MMEILKPVEVSEFYIDRVSKGLKKYFWVNLFKPIFDILKNNSVVNSKNVLVNAIKSGKIYYQDGAFRGKFSNAVSTELEKLGAKFRYDAYYIDKALIPVECASALSIMEAQAAAKAAAINTFLVNYFDLLKDVTVEQFIGAAVNKMYRKLQVDLVKSFQESKLPVIELGLVTPKATYPKTKEDKKEDSLSEGLSAKEIESYWDKAQTQAAKLNKDWQIAADKVKHLEDKGITSGDEYEKAVEDRNNKSIVLSDFQRDKYQNAPKLDYKLDYAVLDEQSKKIAEDYTYNMTYWVQQWEVKNIHKMREEVLDMVQKGARVPTIERYFISRWNIAQNKAHFLAVNESHLAGSVIKATQYQKAGCKRFRWLRSASKEKRLSHEAYYNKIFEFDNPPIIDEKLGIRGLPRQIWNCKCEMVGIPPTLEELQKARNDRKNIVKRIYNSLKRNNNAWRYRRFGEGQAL